MAKPMSDGKLDGWRLALTTMDAVVTHAELMTRTPSSSGYMEAMKAAQTVVANRVAREQERRAVAQAIQETGVMAGVDDVAFAGEAADEDA